MEQGGDARSGSIDRCAADSAGDQGADSRSGAKPETDDAVEVSEEARNGTGTEAAVEETNTVADKDMHEAQAADRDEAGGKGRGAEIETRNKRR